MDMEKILEMARAQGFETVAPLDVTTLKFLPEVRETGVYDEATEAAVRIVQEHAGLEGNGITGPLTWDAVVRLGQPAA